MNTAGYQIQFQKDGVNNYLVIDLPENTEVISYIMKLLERNRIPGLLPVSTQFINGENRFRYDIAGTVLLSAYTKSNGISQKNGMMLLSKLTNVLLSLDSYLIGAEKLLLDAKYLFVGDGMQIFMACVPVGEDICNDFNEDLKKLYLDLISKYLGTGNAAYNEMFMWIYNQELFDLVIFRKTFLEKEIKTQQPEKPEPLNRDPHYKGIDVAAFRSIPEEDKHSIPEVIKPDISPIKVPVKQVDVPENENRRNIGGFLHKREKPEKQKEEQQKATPIIRKFAIPGKGSTGVMQTADGKALNIPGMQTGPVVNNQADEEKHVKQGSGNNQEVKPYLVSKGKQIYINHFPFRIGRGRMGEKMGLILTGNTKVSHIHAAIFEDRGNYYIQDQNSTNGTWLNGQMLRPEHAEGLKDGDEIRIYDEIIRFYLS